jgi:hypothetical protein
MLTSKRTIKDAIEIRNRVLERLKSEGKFEQTNIGPVLYWATDGFSATYRTPFQKLSKDHPDSDDAKYQLSLLKQLRGRPVNLPYGLDIHAASVSRKVMDIEWDENGHVEVVSFHRGEWEKDLLSKCPERG